MNYFGKYPGRVLGNEPEPDADHRGDLLVEVGGFLEDDPRGTGRRPLQVMARPCFPPGMFWVPAVEQPVWVEFVAGRLDQAVWTGVWYPTGQTPRTSDNKAPTRSQKIVRTEGGHAVEFTDPTDDGKDAATVTVADPYGNRVVLAKGHITITVGSDGGAADFTLRVGDSRIEVTKDAITLADAHQHEVRLSSSGVTIAGGEAVALAELAGLFKNHMHMTAMGPAALAPQDTVLYESLDRAGKLRSRNVTMG